MVTVLKPPRVVHQDVRPSLFLAGSIEMGSAIDWQATVTAALDDLDIVILNPRRDDWDASWVQSIHNTTFREQVEWELNGLEKATFVLMYFAPNTRSPITLLELGLCAASGRLAVCCPEGFWRKGNVEVVCAKFGVPLLTDLPALIAHARQALTSAG